MPGDYVTIEVNGREADQAAVSLLEHEGWGHFTAMQVRGGMTRGLDLHLSRLEAAHREIYGRELSGQEVRARIRHALGGRADASVRVYGYWAGVIVTVREPQDMPRRPHSMTAVQFQRPLARLKHVGSWGQGWFREAALVAGFDEGLLADETGLISEGTITNVGFWRNGTVIWPDAPKLDGITMLALRRQLTAAGVGQAEEPVRVQSLGSYQGMILCNSRGWAPVGRVDDLIIPEDETFTGVIAAAMDGCPWDEIETTAARLGMTPVALRPATPADSEFCYQLHKAAMGGYVTAIWGWDEQAQRGFHARAFNVDRWQIITVGGVDAGMLDVEYRPGEIYLSRIEIHPSYQGRGIGTRLVSALAAEARQKGHDLVLDVLAVNHRAQALYQRLGLTEVARHGDGNIKITMRLTG